MESYTLCLAQLAISHIFLGNVADYIEHSEQFFKKNKALNHIEMGIEMMELCGFIYNFCSQLDQAKTFYENSLVKAEDTGDERSVCLSLCNIGIIEAEKDFDTFLSNLDNVEEEEEEQEKEEENHPQLKEIPLDFFSALFIVKEDSLKVTDSTAISSTVTAH